MKKFLACATLAAGVAYAVWSYRQSITKANAAAWAAGTDPVD